MFSYMLCSKALVRIFGEAGWSGELNALGSPLSKRACNEKQRIQSPVF